MSLGTAAHEGSVGVPESSSDLDPAFIIRHKHADELREKIRRGLVPNIIWGVAEMAKACSVELKERGLFNEARVLDMTAGDLDVRVESMRLIAERLGLAPGSEKQLAIERRKQEKRIEHFRMGSESLLRYQPSGVGFTPLRGYFAEWLQGFGLPIRADETLIAPGSFGGIDGLWGAAFAEERKHGRQVDVVFPVPGFTVVAVQAQRRGIPVQFVQAREENGYCVTSDDLQEVLVEPGDSMTLMDLTPVVNPTSEVFNPYVMEDAVQTFIQMRPNGGILFDLAYLDHIPREQAIDLMSRLSSPDVLQHAIFSTSMSKMFFNTGLRIGGLHTVNKHFFRILQAQWQTVFASQSGPGQLEATADWELVSYDDRLQGYAFLGERQEAMLAFMERINTVRQERSKPQIFDLSRVHKKIPLYLYLKLHPGFDDLTCFEQTGIASLSGDKFGDLPENNMVRVSMGVEPLEEAENYAVL